MDHAIDAGKGRAAALVAVRVEFLLCEDITAVLQRISLASRPNTSAGVETRDSSTHLARERHHAAEIRSVRSSQSSAVDQ